MTRKHCAAPTCKTKFVPKRSHQKFCSTKCRVRDWVSKHPRIGVGQAA